MSEEPLSRIPRDVHDIAQGSVFVDEGFRYRIEEVRESGAKERGKPVIIRSVRVG